MESISGNMHESGCYSTKYLGLASEVGQTWKRVFDSKNIYKILCSNFNYNITLTWFVLKVWRKNSAWCNYYSVHITVMLCLIFMPVNVLVTYTWTELPQNSAENGGLQGCSVCVCVRARNESYLVVSQIFWDWICKFYSMQAYNKRIGLI